MILKNINDFDFLHTFDCGQCFRWNIEQDGSYTGVIFNNVINVSKKNNDFVFNCENKELIYNYFDLKNDYCALKSKLCTDEILKNAISHGSGIRILRQQPFETLISFIISTNNNIPRIKKIIESLCENFGEMLEYNGKKYFAFPTCEKISTLTVDDLSIIKSGYRASYIIDAAKKVSSGEVNLDLVFKMNSLEGRKYLKLIKGVGDKVADCVLLFAFQKYDVFPKDVWIKRILNNLYKVENADFDDFIDSKFGDLGGYAQQYLFYYGRELL